MGTLLQKENNNQIFTLKPVTLITYSTKNLVKKDKVRFFYAMKGRNGKPGLLTSYRATQIGITSIIVPKKYKIRFIEVLRKWNVEIEMRDMYTE